MVPCGHQQSACVSTEGLSRWPSLWQPPQWFPRTVNVTSGLWPMLLFRSAMRITTLILYSWTPTPAAGGNPTDLGHKDTGAIHLPRGTTRSPKRSNQGRKRGREAGWSLTAGIVVMAPDWTHIRHVLLSVCGIGALPVSPMPDAERMLQQHIHILQIRVPSFFRFLDVNKFNWTWSHPHHRKDFQHYIGPWKKRKAVKFFKYNFNCYESLMVIKMALNFLSPTCANKVSYQGWLPRICRDHWKSLDQAWCVINYLKHNPWYETITFMEGSELTFLIKTRKNVLS